MKTRRHIVPPTKGLIMPMLFLLLGGCSGFNQDPFATYPETIRNGVPPNKEPEKPQGIPDDALVVETPDYLDFIEGQESAYALKARVLIPGTPTAVEIKNLPSGATYDAAKGEIRWNPPRGTVVGVDKHARHLISVVAKMTKAPFYEIGPKEIPLHVYRDYNLPKVSLANLPTTIREGNKYDFQVLIDDPDTDGVTPPAVIARGVAGLTSPSLIPQIVYQSPTLPFFRSTDRKWLIYFQINTTDAQGAPIELTKNKTNFTFLVKAYSVNGVPSADVLAPTALESTARNAVFSWETGVTTVRSSEQNFYTFQVFDPYGDSKVDVSTVTNLGSWPGGASLTCSQPAGATNSIKSCTLSWNPPSNASGSSYDLDVKATSTGYNANDVKNITVRKTFSVN